MSNRDQDRNVNQRPGQRNQNPGQQKQDTGQKPAPQQGDTMDPSSRGGHRPSGGGANQDAGLRNKR